MHDFVAYVDGGAVDGKRSLYDFNGARNAGAKAPGLGKNDFHDGVSLFL